MIAMVAVLYFWNKQQRKMKREMAREAKSSEFGSNSSDLDLDNIIEEDSTGRGPSGLNRSSDSSSTTETDLERQADGANFKRSGTRATRGGKPARSTSRMYGQPRIKGLRIIPRIPNSEGGDTTSSSGSTSYGAHKLGSRSNTEPGSDSNDTNGRHGEYYNRQNSTRADRERNFINYYESVIPILPTAAEQSPASSATSSSNLIDGKNKQAGLDRPLVPGVHDTSATSLSGQRSLHSMQSEYRRQLNRTDSFSFPKAAQSMATATASQINLMNNYPTRNGGKTSSSAVSRSSSSCNIASANNKDRKRLLTSSQKLISPHGDSRRSSHHSLEDGHHTPNSYSENSQQSSSTTGKKQKIVAREEVVADTSDYDSSSPDSRNIVTPPKPRTTHREIRIRADRLPGDIEAIKEAKAIGFGAKAVGFEETGDIADIKLSAQKGRSEQNTQVSSPVRRTHLSPFETPLRKSQYIAAGDDDEDDDDDDDDDDNIESDSSSFSYREPRRASIDSDQFSNYSSNKRAWLQSVKQGL